MEGTLPDPGSDGQPVYPWFDAYWNDRDRVPLGIWVGEQLVGFCLLRDDGAAWRIAEFYVGPEYRRQMVGTLAIRQVKRMCRTLGRHDELRAKVHHWNSRALAFWSSQGFVALSEDANGVVTGTSLAP